MSVTLQLPRFPVSLEGGHSPTASQRYRGKGREPTELDSHLDRVFAILLTASYRSLCVWNNDPDRVRIG